MEKIYQDGAGRSARPHQQRLLEDIEAAFKHFDVVGLNGPPGIGKTFLARVLQMNNPPCDIITPSNHLLDQMSADYPGLNVVKGKIHYDTEHEYRHARAEARKKTPSIFNFSSYMANRQAGLRRPNLLIVDEAHTIEDLLIEQGSYFVPRHRSGLPAEVRSEWDLVEWVERRRDKLIKAMAKDPDNELLLSQLARIGDLYAAMYDGKDRETTFEVTERVINQNGKLTPGILITPIRLSPELVRARLDASKVLLISGTLTPRTTEILAAGRSFTHLSASYLAPPENRPVFFRPVPLELRTDVPTLAAAVRKIYEAENRQPTMVHVTYGVQRLFAEQLDDLHPIVNGQSTESKRKAEKRFRQDGGIWLASGLAEGVDLKDEACRVVIMPSILFADRSSPYVAKRRGMKDGVEWYGIKALENSIQRLGRGVRHAEDYCHMYILDPLWAPLYKQFEGQFEPLNMIWGEHGD